MDTNEHESENDSFPLQFGVFEVEQDTNATFCDSQVIEHLPSFVVGDSVNDFRVNDHCLERDEVWREGANDFSSIWNAECRLLFEWNGTMTKLNDQRVLVWLFMETMPNAVEHVDSGAEDLVNFVFEKQLLIRVHWCSFVVQLFAL